MLLFALLPKIILIGGRGFTETEDYLFERRVPSEGRLSLLA